MRTSVHILIISAILLSFSSCKKSSPKLPYQDDAFSYFSLEEGNYWLYSATFITIDAAIDQYDTSIVQLRMEYLNFDESLGQHILKRKIRPDSTFSWQEYDQILLTADSLRLEWFEDNIRFVKMTDPVYHLKSWNGNIYNVLPAQNYYYSAVNATFEVNDSTYTPCVRVEKAEINNVIQSNNAYEIFAKGVGPIYEYDEDFNLQAGEIDNGNSKELVLIKFGKL